VDEVQGIGWRQDEVIEPAQAHSIPFVSGRMPKNFTFGRAQDVHIPQIVEVLCAPVKGKTEEMVPLGRKPLYPPGNVPLPRSPVFLYDSTRCSLVDNLAVIATIDAIKASIHGDIL